MNRGLLVSAKADKLHSFLEDLGFDVVPVVMNPSVDNRIADHADISFFFDGDDTLFTTKEFGDDYNSLKLFCRNIVVLSDVLADKYPYDVKLNCVVVGKNFICNTKTVSQSILDHMIKKGYNIIDVMQGYTKCSVVPVNDSAIITDDASVAEKCRFHGIDVLQVSKGDVFLHGFDYGFIGGTAGRVAKNIIIFNGDITRHSDFATIESFLENNNVKYICTEGILTDIGGILPIYKIQE